uniref:Uncharacterized protein n=1 Tax=Rhizophora mucronata TaxID=61149 RepID=A0A2P2IXD4_RHIMU
MPPSWDSHGSTNNRVRERRGHIGEANN